MQCFLESHHEGFTAERRAGLLYEGGTLSFHGAQIRTNDGQASPSLGSLLLQEHFRSRAATHGNGGSPEGTVSVLAVWKERTLYFASWCMRCLWAFDSQVVRA